MRFEYIIDGVKYRLTEYKNGTACYKVVEGQNRYDRCDVSIYRGGGTGATCNRVRGKITGVNEGYNRYERKM